MTHFHLLVRASLAAFVLAGASLGQTLVTDKLDYKPGETTYFQGDGFAPGEEIGLTLKVVSRDDSMIDYAIGGIQADAAGTFFATWIVPDEALGTKIRATALGFSSRRVATVDFTDGLYLTEILSWEIIPQQDQVQVVIDLVVVDTYPQRFNLEFALNGHIYGAWSNSVEQLTGPMPWGWFWWEAGTSVYRCSFTVAAGCDQTVTLRRIAYTGCRGNNYGGPNEAGLVPACRRVDQRWEQVGFPDTMPRVFNTGSCLPCLTNVAPEPPVEIQDLDLGAIVGCLSGGTFGTSATVAVEDFLPGIELSTLVDQEGDPVSVTLSGAGPLDFTGPGESRHTLTLTLTDDPSWRQATSTCELLAASTEIEVSVIAQVVYGVEGPLAPFESGTALLKKRGSVVPIKFRLVDCNGTEVCPATLASLQVADNLPRIDSVVTTTMSPDGDPPIEDPGSSMNNDVLFQYTGDCGADGHWKYNLSTKGPGWTSNLLYTASISLDDGTTRDVHFTLKK